ncbi:CBS domain-containing protein [Marinobacter nanhaiticus D15-8W]|uniref:CBS domain-containing protein n=1 Tax=Marinobacter nanhaiticus D15-8W TaxID=626887 RepID=N6W8A6_9GAMM|nr:CBS domain-containing protein [Marinobacter nanhaiticus]ENO16514.1 CBS domain-containing protein [Marinobacter nanhaiticus D15-8W]BES72305.1 CBS domain-containing protein [Marinobacter nanhaiticus D15-8W]
MDIREIMNADVKLVTPSTTLKDAAAQMAQRGIGFLPIGEDKLAGTITDRDIALRGVAQGLDVSVTTVADIMTDNVLYCFDDTDVEAVAKNMGEKQVRRMPVVDADKRLVGIVSIGDMVPHLQADTCKNVFAGITAHSKAA